MEAVGLALTVTQTVLALLECSDLKELFSKFKYKTELEDLKKTVLTIQSVLQDADDKGVLNHQEQGFVDNLKNALYDADDLLDEFATVAAQEKQCLLTEGKGVHRVSKKVRRLFSRFGKLSVAYGMSQEVKKIRETLDGIASNASRFCFKVDNKPLKQRKETTCSYVYQPDIIGREEDTKRVVDMLLDPNVEGNIPVLTIVGMGGLGKTTLAKLVFNDPRIATAFRTLRLWACVNDEGQPQLNVDSVLGSILKSATDETNISGFNTEQLQRKLQEILGGKKYLIVLDDVWTEKPTDWLKLVEFFKGGQSGSWILVTTRSKGTATAVGSNSKLTYELKGLSDDNSWRLFEGMVGQEQANRLDLVAIGREIVKKCANVPLAIKVIGSLLFGQDEHKWRSVEKYRLSDIDKGENDIMRVLKFSYHHLSQPLKSCFNYCALFPKDCVIDKKMLISLWMAQGYIEPLDRHQSIENAAAEYFLILLRRCFFQDVKKNEFGEIVSCKVHDLMHDVAQEVARKEICASVANFTTISNMGQTIRHINNESVTCTKSFFTKAKIRTYLSLGKDHMSSQACRLVESSVDALLANLMCLRVLDLNSSGIQSLSDTIGGMVHLRYLDLSNNSMEVLPESITKLHNLQTLLLRKCLLLRELPKHFSKLVNLRELDITTCLHLTYMPRGMEKLTRLCKLTEFIVAGKNSSSKQGVGAIEDLGPLKNLKDRLKIQIWDSYRDAKEKRREGAGYLSNKEYLYDICIDWLVIDCRKTWERRLQEQEALLEDLQPHCNLRVLTLIDYIGERMPRWAREDKLATSLRNLVKIYLLSCEQLQELPWLSKLRYLKSIKLRRLRNLEYMVNNNNISTSDGSSSSGISYGAATTEIEIPLFFPSLEELELLDLPKLKGWWRGSGDSSRSSRQPVGVLPWFPRLSRLEISNCPNLTHIPPCPMLETLTLSDINERLRIEVRKVDEKLEEGSTSSGGSSSSITANPLNSAGSRSSSLWDCGSQIHVPKLKSVSVRDVGYLESLTVGDLSCLTEIQIWGDNEADSLSGGVLEKVLCSCSSSLRSLEIEHCYKLRSVYRGGLEHLTALESLKLVYLELMFAEDEDGEEDNGNSIGTATGSGIPWRSLGHTLRSLVLDDLPNMVKLPKGMHHLTSLQSLKIERCPLEELPEWIGSPGCFSSLQTLTIKGSEMETLPDAMRNLTSLTTLDMSWCSSALQKRCRPRNPQGEDWPKIQHIPNIRIGLGWIKWDSE